MDVDSLIVGIPTIIVALIAAVGTGLGKRGETRSAAEAAFRDDLMERLSEVQKQVTETEERWHATQREVIDVQWRLQEMAAGLRAALDALTRVRAWIDAGYPPPPPAVAEAISHLRVLMDRLPHPNPREPPEG